MKYTSEKGSYEFTQAVWQTYDTTDHAFQSSSWFVDVKDRFRIFKFESIKYIAKRTSLSKAREEVEKAQEAFQHVDGMTVENMILRVVVPLLIPSDRSDIVYLVSEYVGTDLNQRTYEGGLPRLTTKQYVNILQFLLSNGVAHPGFLPRNLVEKGENMYLFDWEDALFFKQVDSIKFDRLWYTNFILNWSYILPRKEIDRYISEMLAGAELSEPPLVRYERTFSDMCHLETDKVSEVRDTVESVVFPAELPLKVPMRSNTLRPNDLGHLFADIFFDEMDVVADMASKVARSYSEQVYVEINHVISRFVHLSRDNELDKIHYYATTGLLLLLDSKSYSGSEYNEITGEESLSELVQLVKDVNEYSLAAKFIKGKLHYDQLYESLRTCVKASTGLDISNKSNHLQHISNYIINLQKAAK